MLSPAVARGRYSQIRGFHGRLIHNAGLWFLDFIQRADVHYPRPGELYVLDILR